MMNRSTLSLVTVLSGLCGIGSAQDLTRLKEDERTANRLYAHLQHEAYVALDTRKAACEALTTPADIRAYQQRLREFLVRQLGGIPERTSLDTRTVGTIEADGYRIEKVIFESLPRHHITANLYLPEGNGPFPGVVVSSGHSRTGKTADYNQRFGIMMARHGMADQRRLRSGRYELNQTSYRISLDHHTVNDWATASTEGSPLCRVFGNSFWRMKRCRRGSSVS